LRLLAESSGRPLEADGNVGPREMAVTAVQAAGQNPAYGRPIRPSSLPRGRASVGAGDARGHDSPLRFAERSPTVGRQGRSRRTVTARRHAPDALRPAHDGREARCGAATGLPSGGTHGHDSPLRLAERSPTVGRQGRSRRTVTARRHAPDALRPAHERTGGAVRRRHGPPGWRRARSRLPAQFCRVVTNRRLARPQPTVRDRSTARTRRVATSPRTDRRRGASWHHASATDIARVYSPDSAVRTRIASLSGHSTTSSGAARRIVCRSELLSATPEAVDTPPCSSEAPKP